ncbi:MAG TPA: hypothetical protein VF473_02710 [Cyclobacteriaceae bacterium]
MNKKVYLAVIIVQFVLMSLFLVYAMVQRTQAIKNEEYARLAQVDAEKQAKRAMEITIACEQKLHDCMTH